MTTIVAILVTLLWTAVMILDDSEFCYLWQLKEYRMDRMREFLRSRQGKKYWKLGGSGIRHHPRHPVLTTKAVLLTLLAVAIETGILLITQSWVIAIILFILRFFLFSSIVALFYLPTTLIKRWVIWRAHRVLLSYPQLLVIGVTGSYGKTTVKNFLAHILSGTYNVIATPQHINTDIGVAKFILKTRFTAADIFVVEMGAYRIGEIHTLCVMTHPTIGILTAINAQHLSLFGSMKNIQQAKYELLRSLPTNGLAVTNADNSYCTEFISELRAPSKLFHTEQAMQSTNLAPCLIVAKHLAVPDSIIEKQLKTLPPATLQLHRYGGATIIDDSYNSNPDGFLAALSVLNRTAKDKKCFVVTRGMLELGEKSDALHQLIGEEIGRIVDTLFLINRDAETALRAGIGSGKTQVEVYEKTEDLLHAVQALKNTPSVILVENRIPEVLQRELFHTV